jgi:hypothetical protein
MTTINVDGRLLRGRRKRRMKMKKQKKQKKQKPDIREFKIVFTRKSRSGFTVNGKEWNCDYCSWWIGLLFLVDWLMDHHIKINIKDDINSGNVMPFIDESDKKKKQRRPTSGN